MTKSKKVEIVAQALREYREEWELTNPRPERPRVSGLDFLQFWLFMPVAVIGPLVSAFRTAALLYDNSAFTDPWLRFGEAILGTVFFELAAIVYQFVRLRRIMQERGDDKIPAVGTRWIVIGLIATIGAVTTSNVVEVLFAALAKAGVVLPPVLSALAIGLFVGLGVPLTTVVAGETIGRFLLEFQAAKARIEREHNVALEEWEKRFVRSWNSQKGKRVAALKERLAAEDRQPQRPVQPDRPRPEYSAWRTKEERLEQIVGFVRDHDPRREGVALEEVFTAVWNGRSGSTSTKYADISELVEAGVLVGMNSGRRKKVALKPLTGF